MNVSTNPPTGASLNYSRELAGEGTLSAQVQSVSASTRTAVINGSDTRQPMIPFTFAWGDGSTSRGFFPQSHVYSNAKQNYVLRVTAHYGGSSTDSVDVSVIFVAPTISPVPYPPAATVSIPKTPVTLRSRQPGYNPPRGLQPFADSFFGPTRPRSSVENILSQAAVVQLGILENDVERVNGEWRQVLLHDPSAQGVAYSLWYTSPISFGAAGTFLEGTPDWSSLFHEMGHNLTLNAPAGFRYGGRIDGNANAIFSESVAQMFAHATAYELVNHASRYGVPVELAREIANTAHASASVLQRAYDEYVADDKPFTTWNDPNTQDDETFGTFMTVARQFVFHAQETGSFIQPLTRVMSLLRTFNQSLAVQYAPETNSAEADTFRSTLMVAALSYGFQKDLRPEFRALNFPIDDTTYQALQDLGETARVNVNDLLLGFVPERQSYRTSADTTGCPSGSVGTFSFTATIGAKKGSPPLSSLVVKVAQLSNGNLLQNADGGPSGVGGLLTIPRSWDSEYFDGTLTYPENIRDIPFTICLMRRTAFTFFVDVLGTTGK
jgi:hypothetical protein